MATKTVQMSFSGQSVVRGRIMVGIVRARQEFMEALREEMGIEKQEVIRRTPKDTGALRDSIQLVVGNREKNSIEAAIVGGGPNVNPRTGLPTEMYAAIVHEDLEQEYKVGGPKFIESVLRESAPYMAGRVRRRVDMRRMFG